MSVVSKRNSQDASLSPNKQMSVAINRICTCSVTLSSLHAPLSLQLFSCWRKYHSDHLRIKMPSLLHKKSQWTNSSHILASLSLSRRNWLRTGGSMCHLAFVLVTSSCFTSKSQPSLGLISQKRKLNPLVLSGYYV